MTALLAVDLGAESGRVVRGEFDDDRLHLCEVARFPTGMSRIRGHLRWELDRILGELDQALGQAALGHAALGGVEASGAIASVGVDTWGVDFGLLDSAEKLVDLPVAYRDERTKGVMESFLERIPRSSIYERTGIQFMPLNTLYQLAALAGSGDPTLARARHLLLMPDLVHHHLTGERTTEFTIATTTQCFDPRRGAWDHDLLEAAGVSPSLMQEVVEPGSVVGTLRSELGESTGLGTVPVVAPATHDTASAVAAVPAEGEGWAYISSGTWSLMGVETRAPVISGPAMRLNFTNEGGIAGTNRLLKNITGLWLFQRLRDEMAPEADYGELSERATSATPLMSLIQPDDPRFLNPDSMAKAMADFCAQTDQPVPTTTEAFLRCALESLALRYRAVLGEIEEVTGHRPNTIHVVGGGSRSRFLNQMTADATGCLVVAGPVEATAAGNILAQAMCLGILNSHGEGRELVRRSFPAEVFEPGESGAWDEAWERSSAWRNQS
jgi:rhamnulokinase